MSKRQAFLVWVNCVAYAVPCQPFFLTTQSTPRGKGTVISFGTVTTSSSVGRTVAFCDFRFDLCRGTFRRRTRRFAFAIRFTLPRYGVSVDSQNSLPIAAITGVGTPGLDPFARLP